MPTLPEYPPASTPIDGTELIATWQNGQQVKLPSQAIVDKAAAAVAALVAQAVTASQTTTTAAAAIATAQASALVVIDSHLSDAEDAIAADGAAQVAAIGAALPNLQNAGGLKNLHPDPFFTASVIGTPTGGGFRNSVADSPYTIWGADWRGIISPPAASPYPQGMILARKGNINTQVPVIVLKMDMYGLAEGDTFQIAVEAAMLAAGTATSGTFITGQFTSRSGTAIGGNFAAMVPTVGNPLNTVFRMFNSGNIVVPTGGFSLTLSFTMWAGLPDYGLASMQVVKGAALAKPVQRLALPDAANRIALLEAGSPSNPLNNVLMRRTTYASTTTPGIQGTNANYGSNFAAFGGYGQSYLAAACPTGGFNMISSAWTWVPSAATGPGRLIAVVRTCATGSNPLNRGKTIAWGYIDCDPSTGSAGNEPIQLFDPITGAPKTIMPSDLLDLMGIGVAGVTASGGLPINMSLTYGLLSNADPANVSYQIAGAPAGISTAWGTVGSPYSWFPSLMLGVAPVTCTNVPSPTFAGRVAAQIEEVPALIACPQKMWAIVGQPTWLNYEPLLQRDPHRTIFQVTYSTSIPGTFPTNPSGTFQEGFLLQPAAAGTTTLTLKASNQDAVYDTKAITFVTCLASAGAGSKRFLMMGDSMTANAIMQSSLNTLAAADGVTSIVNVGTMGASPTKNEGYSGMPLGIFFTSGNPFYNPSTSTFDFAYYVANSLAAVPPTHVMIAGGFWNVASAVNDSGALSSSQSACTTIATMIASIHAYSATIKVCVWGQPSQPREGQDGQPRPVTSISQGQMARNLKILASQVIATFSGLEANNTFVVAVNAASNPNTAYSLLDYAPMNNIVANRVSTAAPYANYAAMAADLTPGHNAIVRVTNGAGVLYYIKQGVTGQGNYRSVTPVDGFIRRYTDTIHGDLYQGATQTFAWIKNNP